MAETVLVIVKRGDVWASGDVVNATTHMGMPVNEFVVQSSVFAPERDVVLEAEVVGSQWPKSWLIMGLANVCATTIGRVPKWGVFRVPGPYPGKEELRPARMKMGSCTVSGTDREVPVQTRWQCLARPIVGMVVPR
jgi:hypothetical protein